MLEHTTHQGSSEHVFVLLHSLALDRSVWDHLLPALIPHGTVLTVDLPGHGGSPSAADPTIEGMADEVAALLERRSLGPATVVGLSLGGCVAQALAIGHPQHVRALALLDTTCWYGESAPAAWEGRAQRAVENGLESLASFQIERWFSPGFPEDHPDVAQALLEVFVSNRIDDYVSTCRAMGAMDLRDQLPAVGVPTMIVVGEHDPATPPSDAEMLRELLPNASMHVLTDCSHLSAVEQPAAIGRLLAADLLHRI